MPQAERPHGQGKRAEQRFHEAEAQISRSPSWQHHGRTVVTPWHQSAMAPWHHGTVAPRRRRNMGAWEQGGMGAREQGSVAAQRCSSVAP